MPPTATLFFAVLLSTSAVLVASHAYLLTSPDCDCNGNESCWDCLCQKHGKQNWLFNRGVRCSLPESGANKHNLIAYTLGSFCVTHIKNNQSSILVGGTCPFGGQLLSREPLPDDLDQIDEMMCGEANRAGRLCGECFENHSLVVNSFMYTCVNNTMCSNVNWFTYFVIQFVPLTIIYLLVVFFNIKAMEERANAFIVFAQVVSLELNLLEIYWSWIEVLGGKNDVSPKYLAKAIGGIYGFWNLDIAQGMLPKICLTGHITILEAFSLQYVTALYPLILILLTYILIELHGKNCRILVWLWKPIHNRLARCRRQLDPKTSIIDAFATFLLLSYTKFTVVSFNLLSPTALYDLDGNKKGLVLLYNGAEDYFATKHLAYSATALAVLILVVIPPPLLLILYPTKTFQRCLDRCNLRSHFLTTFTDAYQGCYKDSSNGTRDCRFFAGLYFILRIIIFALYSFVIDYFVLYSVLQVVMLAMAGLFATFRPYKKDIYNSLDTLIFLFFAFLITLINLGRVFITQDNPSLGIQITLYIRLFVPAFFLLCFKGFQLFSRLCRRRQRYLLYQSSQHTSSRSVLHGLLHPREYSLITQPRGESSMGTAVYSSSDTSSDSED